MSHTPERGIVQIGVNGNLAEKSFPGLLDPPLCETQKRLDDQCWPLHPISFRIVLSLAPAASGRSGFKELVN